MEYSFLFYLGPIIICIIGAFLLIIGFVRTNRLKAWKETEGVVVRGKRGMLNIFLPTVKYVADGKDYVHASNILQVPLLSTGTKVTVLYHPEEPKRALIDTFMQRGEIIKIIGVAFLVLGILFIVMFSFLLGSLNQ